MNEPKKSELEAAASAKFPGLRNVRINQRKHTATVEVVLEAKTHRELLAALKGYATKS